MESPEWLRLSVCDWTPGGSSLLLTVVNVNIDLQWIRGRGGVSGIRARVGGGSRGGRQGYRSLRSCLRRGTCRVRVSRQDKGSELKEMDAEDKKTEERKLMAVAA